MVEKIEILELGDVKFSLGLIFRGFVVLNMFFSVFEVWFFFLMGTESIILF